MANETQIKQSQSHDAGQGQVHRAFAPPVDIYETDAALVLLADLPGVDQGDLEVTLERNTLSIRGKSQEKQEEDDFKLLYSEYNVGDFERSFTVSDEIDRDGIEAKLRNGVLRLILPKSKRHQPRKIDVKIA